MARRAMFLVISPTVAFLLLALSAATGCPVSLRKVVISEIAWMGTTTSEHDEWIELYNNTTSAIDLTGWTLKAADGTPDIPLNGTIPPGNYFLLERTDDDSVPDVAADQTYSGAMGDPGEDLVLSNDTPSVIDRVNCSTGWFASHKIGRVPMVRVDTLADGSLDGNWT